MEKATLDAFHQEVLGQGYQEVLERRWDPHAAVPEHSHPFDAKALVAAGEMWLTVGGSTRHLREGDRFEVGRNVPHTERYGPDGATYWAARRS